MKALKFFVLFTFVAAIVSCSSDDDAAAPTYEFNKANLVGDYHLDSYHSIDIKTQNINGFDVTTTTESVASTINFTYEFSSDNQVITNGNFVIDETKKQGTQQTDTTYIVNVNLQEMPYSINVDDHTIGMNGETYKVSNFSENGFSLKTHVEETIQDGTREYTEELKLSR